MIKLMFCLRRLPELSRAEFQDYWREVHAPLVAERAELLGIARYVQCHTADDSLAAPLALDRGDSTPFDGVAELWLQAPKPTYTQEEIRRGQLELLSDERRFIDLSASPIFFTREHEAVRAFLDTKKEEA